MEVVGWSPSEELQESDMFLPLQAEGWNGVEDGESSPYAGPSSSSVPRPSSPPIESATAYQRRLKNPEHVPRPRNAFIIFRCEFTNNYVANGGSERASDTEKRSLSKRAGEAWGNATLETKRHYKELADQERARHRLSHPDYRFRPKRQKSAGQTGGRRSSKRGVSSPRPKRPASRSSPASPVECNKLSQNDPLQIKTITIPTSSSTLSQPYLSRHPTPDFSHGCGSTTPTSPCSPLSPVDDILYMPRPTIAADHPDSLLSYSTDDSQFYGYPKDPLASLSDELSLFSQVYSAPDQIPPYGYPPLAAVASSLAGWDGNGQERKENADLLTPESTFYYKPDPTDPLVSFLVSDGVMGFTNAPFGPDAVNVQFDMNAYRMGLKEYGITPASIH